MSYVHQKIVQEYFLPNFHTEVSSLLERGYFVKAIVLDHEGRYYWALLEKQAR